MKNKFIPLLFLWVLLLTLRIAECQEWKVVRANFDPPGEYHLNNGIFIDRDNGWLTTSDPPRIFHTTDGGKHFTLQFEKNNDGGIWDMDFIDGNTGWAVGTNDFVGHYPFILRTSDGGITWEFHELITLSLEIEFFNTFYGLAAAWEEIYFTEDGGLTWQNSKFPDTVIFRPKKFFFINNNFGWAVGGDGNNKDCGMILKTYDSGRTWHTSLYEIPDLFSIAFADSLHGCAVGFSTHYTEDGGNTWEWGDHRRGGYDVAFSDDTTAWSVDGQNVSKTTDLGKNWVTIKSMPNYNLRQIIFVDSGKVGYIPGLLNTLLKYEARPVKVQKAGGFLEPDFQLYQNYPNPFNSFTIIHYKLPINRKVELTVYNVLGEKIETLVNEQQTAGSHEVQFRADALPSGIYFYEIKYGPFQSVKKMLLIR